MKVSLSWLQNYFDEPLPDADVIADALTFHAFEIEEIEKEGADAVLEVKVLPDRAAYALSHRGIAREISAALSIPLKDDPLRDAIPEYPSGDLLSVSVEDEEKTPRYMGALVKGVNVAPSPAWLREALESVGQRSINNVVDATNYVMLNIGQPLHAFDAAKLTAREGKYAIRVRSAIEDEKITTLTGEEYVLPQGVLLITDANTGDATESESAAERGTPIGIAGVKGGKAAEIAESTTDIIIESANFDSTLVRRASQALKLWTDASMRFQNKPSPALVAYGMRDVLKLIQEIAGGEVVDVVDVYAPQETNAPVSVSLARINSILGAEFTLAEVRDVFDRLGFSYTEEEQVFTVLPSFERRDIAIPQDLAEEVGRILGYDRITPVALPEALAAPDQSFFRGLERIKDFFIERGWNEISTPSFAAEGEIILANPLDQTRPALRASLLSNMHDALLRAIAIAPRVIGPDPMLRLFEVGTVFTKDSEHILLALGYAQLSGRFSEEVVKETVAALDQELFATHSSARYSLDGGMVEINLSKLNIEKLGDDYAPVSVRLGSYVPFSVYPFALRDIAVWTPAGTEMTEVENVIVKEAGEFLARIDQFDRFEKEADGATRISYAFRLVFESKERTLSDADLDPAMERVTKTLNAINGYKVR